MKLRKDGSATINLYAWSGYQNFGDELSAYLVKRITGREVKEQANPSKHCLIAIGSLLNEVTMFSAAYIWGTGCRAPCYFRCNRLHKLFPLNRFIYHRLWGQYFNRSIISVLRGPLTYELVAKLGFPKPKAYGDPGILMPYFYTPQSLDKKYKLGIIFHQVHAHIPQILDKDIRYISINRSTDKEIHEFIDEVCACDAILSSSLHGLIIAQAYGIPARNFFVKDLPICADESFKFKDYLLGTGQNIAKQLILSQADLNNKKLLLEQRLNASTFDLRPCAERVLKNFPDI